MLTPEQKSKILKLARDSILHYLKNGKRLSAKETDPALTGEMGAFVTLRKNGHLRGCIGNIVGKQPFYLSVSEMAVEAATSDPRFNAVTENEMGEIDIEVSALSPLEKIDSPGKIQMRKHGVLVSNGPDSGVYLPQVADDREVVGHRLVSLAMRRRWRYERSERFTFRRLWPCEPPA